MPLKFEMPRPPPIPPSWGWANDEGKMPMWAYYDTVCEYNYHCPLLLSFPLHTYICSGSLSIYDVHQMSVFSF